MLGKSGASHSLLVTTLLLLLGRCGCAFLLLVHDEARVALFGIPLEACEVGSFANLIIGLSWRLAMWTRGGSRNGKMWKPRVAGRTEERERLETYLLLELFVDGI